MSSVLPYTAPSLIRDRLLAAMKTGGPTVAPLIERTLGRRDLGPGELLLLATLLGRLAPEDVSDRAALWVRIVSHPSAVATVWLTAYDRSDPMDRERVVDAVAGRSDAWADPSVVRQLLQWDAGRLAADPTFQDAHLAFPVPVARRVLHAFRQISDRVVTTLLRGQGTRAGGYLEGRDIEVLCTARSAELRLLAVTMAAALMPARTDYFAAVGGVATPVTPMETVAPTSAPVRRAARSLKAVAAALNPFSFGFRLA